MTNNNNLPATQSSASLPQPAAPASTRLGGIASDEQRGEVLDILKASEFARANNFDLIGEDGWALLQDELAADFPYLTLADLNATIRLGLKGKLDTYKNRPLNFTRVYQWVEQRAPYSLGYWQTRHPELMAWAELTRVTAAYVAELTKSKDANGVVIPVPSVAKTALRTLVGTTYYPNLFNGLFNHDEANQMQQLADRNAIERTVWPAFAAKYPDFAFKHPNLF